MRHSLILLLLSFPALALAQNYNSAAVVVVGGNTVNNVTNATTADSNAAPGVSTTPSPTTSATAAPAANPLAKIPAVPPNFPAWAVSQAGQNTAGNNNGFPPGSPPNPPSPTMAVGAGAPASPAPPPSPTSPASPAAKLWPRDTVPIFVKSCVGFHVELAPACSCVITTLMGTMPHYEFLKESANNTIESDPRLVQARQNCIATPGRQ